jgi:hypothetical protein
MPSTDRKLELKAKTSVAQTASQVAVYAKGLIRNSELPDDGAIQTPKHVGADIIKKYIQSLMHLVGFNLFKSFIHSTMLGQRRNRLTSHFSGPPLSLSDAHLYIHF